MAAFGALPKKDSVEQELIQVAAVAVQLLEHRGWTQAAALTDIRHERFAQDEKFGDQSETSRERMLVVLMEEVGELAKALLWETGGKH